MTLWPSPPLAPLLAPGEIHLWRVPLAPLPDDLAPLKQFLCAAESARADRLLDRQKGAKFILCRARLRQILATYLQSDPARIEFSYGLYGKPALTAAAGNRLHFNLSHAGHWAVLALSADAPLGVDIEKIDPLLDYAKLAARFFSAAENGELNASAPQRRRRVFYRLWTRNEARLKGEGRGFSAPTMAAEILWQVRSFWLAPGYVAAVASVGVIKSFPLSKVYCSESPTEIAPGGHKSGRGKSPAAERFHWSPGSPVAGFPYSIDRTGC